MNEVLLKTLKKYWGYTNFKENQLELCVNVLNGRDSFAVMATGAGKSLTFQLPSIALREMGCKATSIVICPLISLIDDQVSSLLSIGISACGLGSNSSNQTEMQARNGEFTVVYATPEKILSWSQGIRDLMHNAKVTCIAIDESHCVSEWGHDFRPNYRQLGKLRDEFGTKLPIIALTASATPAVQSEIINSLKLKNPLVVSSSLNRSNLKYFVMAREGPNDLIRVLNNYRKQQLQSLQSMQLDSINISNIPFYPTLVYVNTKNESEELSKLLVQTKSLTGIRVAYYHSGMSYGDRTAVHQAFMQDEIQIIIATVAFGMGFYFSFYLITVFFIKRA
jgi:RecQ family ATP-dependent DNA helicase